MLLIRISLILAIIAGIAAGVIGFVQVKPAIETLKTQYADEQTAHKNTQTEKKKVEKELANTADELKQEKGNHDNTKSQLAKANTARADAEKRANGLSSDLQKTKADLTASKQELAAWESTGTTPDKIKEEIAAKKEAQAKVGDLEKERELLLAKIKKHEDFIAVILGKTEDENPEEGPIMQGPIKGRVLTVDPKWQFVVVDVGSKNGLVRNGVLLVGRDGRLIAKIKVREVKEESAVAFIMKGWNLTDVVEGDIVVY